jgi:amidase
MKRLTRDRKNIQYFVDAAIPPCIHVQPGELVCLETIRADNMFLSHQNPVFLSHEHVMEQRANPVTGPIYVQGAEPGDRLQIHILEIALGDDGSEGYYTYVPGQGIFANPFMPFDFPPATEWCDVSGKELTLPLGGHAVKLPAKPFIGTLSVAPREEPRLSFWNGKDILGNVDCPRICAGNTVTMPVNVRGGLLSLGDLHAAQGAGELLGCAVECSGCVTFSVELIKAGTGSWFGWPTVDGDHFLGSLGFVNNDLNQAIRHAFYDLVKRIEDKTRASFLESYMFAGQCVNIELCQNIGGFCTVLATIDRELMNEK